jgi:hypothetical protein
MVTERENDVLDKAFNSREALLLLVRNVTCVTSIMVIRQMEQFQKALSWVWSFQELKSEAEIALYTHESNPVDPEVIIDRSHHVIAQWQKRISRHFSLLKAPYQIATSFKHNFPVSIIKRFSIERKHEEFIMKEMKRTTRCLTSVLNCQTSSQYRFSLKENTTSFS